MEQDAVTLLEARLSELGLTAPNDVSLTATLTPERLARLRADQATEDSAFPPSDNVKLHVAAPKLPRISIEERVSISPPDEKDDDETGGAARTDYAVLGTIGEGGMGRVYLAHQRSLARDVAVKALKPGARRGVADALLREARITGALEHPGVIPIHVLGRDDSSEPVIVMKRVNGVDLGALLANDSHPAWKARGRSDDRLVAMLEILTQVFFTVEFAHSRGIIHRDIKPENIMVGSFGEVYLLDWGIAVLLSEASARRDLLGTPACMAPEMACGEPIDERTDVYLLGATLHEMLTHRPRHQGATIREVLTAAIASTPLDYAADVPEALARICNRATARDPSMRHASVEELREDISDFLRHRTARSLSDAAFERLIELEALLGNAGDGPPKELARAYQLAIEARFGFTQSLIGHADESAASGMRRCIELAIDLELRQAHADSAEALSREMAIPDPDLERRIDELRTQEVARARDRERLEQLERNLDPTPQAKSRAYMLVAFGALLSIVSGLAGYAELYIVPTLDHLLLQGCAATLVICGGLFVARRRALSTVFNQRGSALTLIAMLALVAHRLLAFLTRAPFHATILTSGLVEITVVATAAVTMHPRVALCLLPLVAGLVTTTLWPRHAMMFYIAMNAAGFFLGAVILSRLRHPSERP